MAARENEVARRLLTIPGVGPVIASALRATVIDARLFRNGRKLAAWIGLLRRLLRGGLATSTGQWGVNVPRCVCLKCAWQNQRSNASPYCDIPSCQLVSA